MSRPETFKQATTSNFTLRQQKKLCNKENTKTFIKRNTTDNTAVNCITTTTTTITIIIITIIIIYI